MSEDLQALTIKQSPTDPKNAGLISLLKDLAALTTLITALLYYTGYIALGSYFATFNIDVSTFDLPFAYVLVYSLFPVSSVISKATLCTGLLFDLTAMWYVWKVSTPTDKSSRYDAYLTEKSKAWLNSIPLLVRCFLFLLVLLGAWFVVFLCGSSNGSRQGHDAQKQEDSFIHVVWKETDKPQPRDERLIAADNSCSLREVFQNKDLVALFTMVKGKPLSFVVSRSDIASLTVGQSSLCLNPQRPR